MPQEQKPKYIANPSGNITRGEEIVGTFDPETGRILAYIFPDGAMPYIKSLILDVIVEGRAADVKAPLFHTEEAMHAAVDETSPPPPPMNPMLGDKTPEYIKWMQTYRPEEYEQKYKDRKTHVTTGGEPYTGGGDLPRGMMSVEREEEWK
jgi:hypothetical protein